MSPKIFFSLPVILVCTSLSLSQAFGQASIIFFDIIEEDSAALYFNKDFSFTEKDCYDYVRRIRVTGNGDFNGYFEDRTSDQILLGRGNYSGGVKHGYFEIYYPNGRVQSVGYYENNVPVGIWQYFHESGLPERTLEFKDSVVSLVRYVDREGIVQVKNGSGKFDGAVAGLLKFDDGLHVRGNIVDGQPDGKWYVLGPEYRELYMEKFDHGKLLKSSFVSKRKMQRANVPSLLNTFFLVNYLFNLENFEKQSCSETQQYFFNRYPSDFRFFSFDLRRRMNYLIETDVRANKGKYYGVGDNFMSIRFSVNDSGKASNITLLTEWGDKFFDIAKNAINKTVFSTSSKTMYFHFKMSYAGGNRYRYTFRFSKRDRN